MLIVAGNGGAEYFFDMELIPQVIIGDTDSIDSDLWKSKSSIEYIRYPEAKDKSDAAGEGGGITATFTRDKALEGYVGVVYGGIVSSILDGAMGHCVFSCGQVAVTVEMTTRFRHPVVTNRQAIVSAHIARFCHPLCILEAEIVQDGKVKATAKGKFYNKGADLPFRECQIRYVK